VATCLYEKENNMSTKKFHRLFALLAALVLCLATLSACANPNEAKYLEAFDMIEAGNYAQALALFTELGDYKDAAKEAARFRYVPMSCVGTYSGEKAMPNETTTVTLNENNLPAQCFVTFEDGTTHTCTYTYNENGKLTRIFCTDPSGDLATYESVYNADGKLEKETTYYLDGENVVYEYTYNAQGEFATMSIVASYGYNLKYEYSYGDNGNLVKVAVVDSEEECSYHLTYDENNVLIKELYCDDAGNILKTEDFSYDGKGNLLKVTCTEDGEVTELTEYTYDEKGRLLSDRYHDTEDGYIRSNEYTYTADGRTEKFYVTMPGEFEDTQELSHKLVYIPFEYTEEEWDNIVRMY
jgi:YD repeat-containing protein